MRYRGVLQLRRIEDIHPSKPVIYRLYERWHVSTAMSQDEDLQFHIMNSGHKIHELSMFELVVVREGKVLPLKHSQWLNAITDNNLSSTKLTAVVDFSIMNLTDVAFAKILPPSKYERDDVESLVYRAYLLGRMDHGSKEPKKEAKDLMTLLL